MAFNQRHYVNAYNKDNYKSFIFRVRKNNVDVINKLKSVSSINGYLEDLVTKDMSNILTIKQIKEIILPILKKHNIGDVYLFGSYSRGEANSNSDVDIYCDPGDIKTFVQQGFLEDELENALGKKVDIVFIGSKLDAFFEEQLMKDRIKLC